MAPRKTVSKLRSTPAPYLAQAPAPKLGVGVDLNRYRHRVSSLLGPDTVLTRSRPYRDADPISLRDGPYLDETAPRPPTTCSAMSRRPAKRAVERDRQRDDWGVGKTADSE